MAVKDKQPSGPEQLGQAIGAAIYAGASGMKFATEAARSATEGLSQASKTMNEAVMPTAHKFVEQSTETVGKIVTPIAKNPLIQFAKKVPGINLLATALGQVDETKAQQDVDQLRAKYPLEAPDQLAQRIIADTAMKAGGIGLLTNFVPPLALMLFAVDIVAVTTLQAEMVYRIAAAYGFPLDEPTRRGEVLAIFGLSLGGSSALKVGLGLVELVPALGAVVGASSDAALLYALGTAASRFYEEKRKSLSIASEQPLS